MGKRRVRCLKALGHSEIFGYDAREDRQTEAADLGIELISNVATFLHKKRPVCIISVPPDRHLEYMQLCVKHECHFFVEASVILEGMEQIALDVTRAKIVGAPSCTLLFHPAIQVIRSILDSKIIGSVSNVIYHSGQYLPDWHPYEKVSDFYVSKRETGGCREIVPFELTWLCSLLGFPVEAKGIHAKTISIPGADQIDDTYNMCFRFKNGGMLSLVVDVVSRVATRTLVINGSEAQLRWNWEEDFVSIYHSSKPVERVKFVRSQSHAGYNANIGEGMYINEIEAFLTWIKTGEGYPTDLNYDVNVLKVLEAVEAAV